MKYIPCFMVFHGCFPVPKCVKVYSQYPWISELPCGSFPLFLEGFLKVESVFIAENFFRGVPSFEESKKNNCIS